MHHSILPHPIVKFQLFSPFHRKSRQNISYQCERPDDIASSKSPRQSFPAQGRENKSKSVFPGDMRIGKNTSQPASVASGRPLTRCCMQRAASPLKNAGIFEKRVELVRHAKYPGPGNPVRGIWCKEISERACGPPQPQPGKQHRPRGSERAPSPGSHLRSEAHPQASG